MGVASFIQIHLKVLSGNHYGRDDTILINVKYALAFKLPFVIHSFLKIDYFITEESQHVA
jgi:hypothetical protein